MPGGQLVGDQQTAGHAGKVRLHQAGIWDQR